MKKRSYKLKKIKDLDGNDNVVCIVGKVISLEPLLIEDEGFKIRLIMDNSNLNLGDYVRVFVRLSFSEEIPFGKPDIVQKIDLNEEEINLYLNKYKKYIGEYYES
jgi:hypothetical protein